MNNQDCAELQAVLGYTFVAPEHLTAALTHSSYVNEHSCVGNERIEFLGDCVLNFLVGERLFFSDPTASEGGLSARRAATVSRAPLARIVDSLGLLKYLKVGAGVDKSAFSQKARSDVFEALLGAVYIDGGLDACRAVLDKVFYGSVVPEADHKSAVQRYAADNRLAVKYSTEQTSDGGFLTTLTLGERSFTAVARSKHLSEIAAAERAVSALIN